MGTGHSESIHAPRSNGTDLYSTVTQGEHQDWGTLILILGRNEVAIFSSATRSSVEKYQKMTVWRVDAVASMLYLDYSRNGESDPERNSRRENLVRRLFPETLRGVCSSVFPAIMTIAEEIHRWPWPLLYQPTILGGLGFASNGTGWMHDFLHYKCDRIRSFRRFHHNSITFSLMYAFAGAFILVLSHDEVCARQTVAFSIMNRA